MAESISHMNQNLYLNLQEYIKKAFAFIQEYTASGRSIPHIIVKEATPTGSGVTFRHITKPEFGFLVYDIENKIARITEFNQCVEELKIDNKVYAFDSESGKDLEYISKRFLIPFLLVALKRTNSNIFNQEIFDELY